MSVSATGSGDTSVLDDLVVHLPAWLPAQRWFAGKDREVTGVRVVAATTVLDGDPLLLHVVVAVDQDDRSESYQLLVASRQDQLPDVAASATIAPTAGGAPGSALYEASGDADLTAVLLDLMADGATVGDLRFETEAGVQLERGLRAHPITSEQSNTSLVYGSQYILKLFRKLAPGVNKDVLLHRALREVGCTHIAEPLGTITGRLASDAGEDEIATIGMLQRFMPDAVDGWTMATTSVRDLMADLASAPDEVGGDFSGEAWRLGQAVAHVHEDLARALGTQSVDETLLRTSADAMVERLDAVVTLVPELGRYRAFLAAAFAQLSQPAEPLTVQYVHGDLHLGQVLRTVGGWLLLDFEGEPAAPAAERLELRSPLRDVAGMLRSFDYAAHQLLVRHDPDPLMEQRAAEWAQLNRDAFCEGYAQVAGADPRAQAAVLRALELDKAVYEVAYEHANRPDWLAVPLSSIARIAEEE